MTKEKNDAEESKKERRCLSIIDYKFSQNGKWVYRKEAGQDVGCDCTLELVDDNDTFQGKRACCQVKGRTSIDCLKDKKTISLDLEVTTYNMAVQANYLFILLLVDLNDETVYFQKLNGYGEKSDNSASVAIHIPVENVYPNNERKLKDLFIEKGVK